MKAKVYDFDPSYDVPDGEDNKGEYVIRNVEGIEYQPHHVAYLRNGLQSQCFEVIEE